MATFLITLIGTIILIIFYRKKYRKRKTTIFPIEKYDENGYLINGGLTDEEMQLVSESMERDRREFSESMERSRRESHDNRYSPIMNHLPQNIYHKKD